MSRNQKYYDDDDMYDYDDDEDYVAPSKPKPKTKAPAVIIPPAKVTPKANTIAKPATNTNTTTTTTVFKVASSTSTTTTAVNKASESMPAQSVQTAAANSATATQKVIEPVVVKDATVKSTPISTHLSTSTLSTPIFQYEDFSDDDEINETSASTSTTSTPTIPNVTVVITGHVDAGKSTLLGHLLYNLGDVSQRIMHKYERQSQEVGKGSFALAWVMDDTQSERDRGVTIDIAERYISTTHRNITLIDSPGHRDFVPAMISGAHQADAAVLVIPAVEGEFESSMSENAQTFEHAQLLQALGVKHVIVAVNKMDSTLPESWSENRFIQVSTAVRALLTQQLDFDEKEVVAVPVSGLTGMNLMTSAETTSTSSNTATKISTSSNTSTTSSNTNIKGSSASSNDNSTSSSATGGVPDWYTGPTLLDCLNQVPYRLATNNTANSSNNSNVNIATSSTAVSSNNTGARMTQKENSTTTKTAAINNNDNIKNNNNNSFRAVVSGIISEGSIHKGFELSVVILRGRIHVNRTLGIAGIGVCTVKKIVNSRTSISAGVSDTSGSGSSSGSSMEVAQAGDNVILTLVDRQNRPFHELIHLRAGVCLFKRFSTSSQSPPSVVRCLTKFVASIQISPSVPSPVLIGTAFELYSHGAEVECFISKILSVQLKSIANDYASNSNSTTQSYPPQHTSLQPQKSKFKCIPVNAIATVEITCQTPIALECFHDFEPFGRFILRTHGKTVAVGKVIEMKS